jgi:LAS superfamily LD-carboxypeptidase LdcB
MFNALELTGRSATHVVDVPELGCRLHPGAADALRAMRRAAAEVGIDLFPISGFRDFDRQAAIWNAKFRGERPVLDRVGGAVDPLGLEPDARIDALLCWSALPGASRHHWGTDVDAVDRAAMPEDYRVQLVPGEYAPGGVFARLAGWLDGNAHRFGFFRPYATDRGGVQPEAWHLSYAPLAGRALEQLTPQVLAEAIAGADIEGRDAILARLPALHARFVAAIDPVPPAALGPAFA